jgi:hypothetical protein
MFSRNAGGERRVSPRTYKALLKAHIVASVRWLGVTFAKLVLGVAAVMADGPEVTDAVHVSVDVLNRTFPPLALGTIATGVLLSLGTKWGLLRHYWVASKIVLTVGVVATAVQVAPRLMPQAGAASAQLGADGGTLLGVPLGPALLVAFAVLHLLMLVAATVLSVYKPWGTTWLARRRQQPASGVAGLGRGVAAG